MHRPVYRIYQNLLLSCSETHFPDLTSLFKVVMHSQVPGVCGQVADRAAAVGHQVTSELEHSSVVHTICFFLVQPNGLNEKKN